MGQAVPISKRNAISTDAAQYQAVAYLEWIKQQFGNRSSLIPYLAEMMTQEISELPKINGHLVLPADEACSVSEFSI